MPQPMTLNVTPAERFVTEPYKIVLTGAPAGAQITIDATLTDGTGQAWSSRGIYLSDLEGTVDTSKNASLFGTYRGIDAEALIWSMQPATLAELESAGANMDRIDSPRRTPDFDKFDVSIEERRDPVSIDVTARVTGDLSDLYPNPARGTHKVKFFEPDLRRTDVNEDNLVGVLYEAAGNGPHPLVILVTGSDGGCYEARAAMLASHGITAFAVAHFNYPGVPEDHHNTPLEYFSQAMTWLATRFGRKRVAVFGSSRGGEGALLIASAFPEQVSGVVADVPSNIVNAGLILQTLETVPGWTLNGESLPYLTVEDYSFRDSDIYEGTPEGLHIFRDNMASVEESNPCVIPVEKIEAPILLISGTADAMWPSTLASQKIIRRLEAHGFSHKVTHLDFEGAGHLPSFPMIVKSRADRTEVNYLGYALAIGGTPEANAHAQSVAFPKIVDFLKAIDTADALASAAT